MKNIIFTFLIIGLGLSTLCFSSYAEDAASSAELINNAKEYDGKEVVFKGEVIGDIMARGEFAWININDGVNAIGIWSKKDLAKDIVYAGSYKSKGDIIEVKGIFHRACLEHGGDLDIHIDELYKINSGMEIKEEADIARIKLAGALSLVLCIAIIWSIKRGKK